MPSALSLLMMSMTEPLPPDRREVRQVAGSNGPERLRGAAVTPEGAVAHVLDLGMRLGDPFPTRSAMPPMSSEAHARKARSIVRLAAVARARGMDRSGDVVRTLEAVRQMLLAEKLMQTLSDSIGIDQHVVREQFDRFPDRYDEFDLSHIFLSWEQRSGSETGGDEEALDRALKAQARLRAGEDFAIVASEASDDKETAVDGGVLPTILGVNIQQPFLDTVRIMKPGTVSGIVKGDKGYHIIKLVRRTHAYNGPAQDMIEREIRTREMRKLLPELQRLEDSAK